MMLCPLAVARRCKELKIQAGFDHCKNKILKKRADIKAEKERARQEQMEQLASQEA